MASRATTSDERDRQRASADISTSYLVEAGAGTGKTTVLLNRILSIVRSGRARLDEIAAITFTEKAAGELKMRLRAELEKAAAEGGEHVQQALQDLERAQVSTIHSFCAGMLRELPVEAQVDPGFRVADQLMASLLLSDVWARWLERQMSGENPALRMAIELGAGLEDDIETLARELAMNRDILDGAPKPIETLNLGESVERFRRDVARLLELAKSCMKPEEDGCCQQIRRLRTVANELKTLAADAPQLQVVLCRDIVIKPREGNQSNWKPKSKCAEAKAILGEMKDAQSALKQVIAHNALARLVECLRGFVAEYEAAKREANLLDFQDLLLLARDMLRNSRAARDYFKRRFRFILLDEFQDTDPLQAEVAFFLAEQANQHADDWVTVAVEPGKLFLVGDPKQSIYRFRRADIEMYHQGRARLEAPSQRTRSGASVLHITENFRCAPQIVEWVNAAFAALIQKSADGDYQPEYVPLVAHERETPPGAGVVLLWPEDRREAPDAAQVRADEAQHIASFVKRAVQEGWQVWDKAGKKLRALRYSDVAVLFRAQSYLDVYEDAMRDQDVPYRVAGGKAFYKRQEIKSLLAVLSALDSPQDAVALVAALRTPFLGVSDEDLFLFRQSGGEFNYLASPPSDAPQSVADALKLLRELHEKRNSASVTRLLQEMLDRTKALELFRLKPQGEQRVANLLKILDTSRALEDTGIITFRGFVRWLRQFERTEEEEAESPISEQGDDFVHIMTIHKAKGLEFPLVVLADWTSGKARVGAPGTSYAFVVDRRQGAFHFKFDAELTTASWAECEAREMKRSEAEWLRMFYVATTRARDYLVLPMFWKNQEGFVRYIAKRLLAASEQYPGQRKVVNPAPPVAEAPPFRLKLEADSDGGQAAESALAARRAWRAQLDAGLTRASVGRKLVSATRLISELGAEEAAPAPQPVLTPVLECSLQAAVPMALQPRQTRGTLAGRLPTSAAQQEAQQAAQSRNFGTLVHHILAAVDLRAPGDVAALARAEAAAMGLPAEMADEAARLVSRALDSPLMQRARRADECYREVPFVLKLGDAIVEGALDLVFVEKGRLVLADFKTDRVTAQRADSHVAHYRPQFGLYALALKQVLGKPPDEAVAFFVRPLLERRMEVTAELLAEVIEKVGE